MNKIILFLIVAITLFSCNKDECTEVKEVLKYTPIYKSMSEVRTVNRQAPKAITASGKIFVTGNYIYLNEPNKGFHIINNSNPNNPINEGFMDVPGNLDLVAKGNYLFADNFIDLLSFDISNPAQPNLITRKQSALPLRIYNYGFSDDSAKGVIVDFIKEKVTEKLPCAQSFPFRGGWGLFSNVALSSAQFFSVQSPGSFSSAGSLSRFTVNNNHLYAVSRSAITPIDISNGAHPVVKPIVTTFTELETVYAFKNHLLIGGPRGMFIYGLTNPELPTYKSQFNHWRGCDPVVAQGNLAYVTVRGGGPCGGARDVLDIIDISNFDTPRLLKNYQMENPYGLGIDGTTLTVCDGKGGFKVFDANDHLNIQQKSAVGNTKFFDVIMMPNKNVVAIAQDGLYQYNLNNLSSPTFLSKISIQQ